MPVYRHMQNTWQCIMKSTQNDRETECINHNGNPLQVKGVEGEKKMVQPSVGSSSDQSVGGAVVDIEGSDWLGVASQSGQVSPSGEVIQLDLQTYSTAACDI